MSASPPDDPADLDFSPDQLQAMGEAVLRRVVAHLASLPDQPSMGDTDGAALCRELAEPAPEQGAALESLLDPLFDDWVGRSFNTARSGYLAYVPGGGVFPAALADLIADTTNRFSGAWQAAPALVQLEANVLDWFAEWMGFPDTTRGLLSSGGSLAALSAIVCARETHLGTRLRDGVMYLSDQAHHCMPKAARLAGVLSDRVRVIPAGADCRWDLDALTAAIEADRTAGLAPFLVVSTAGTTNTGTVDPLDAVADLCAEQGLWHHVDGAYGAFFQLVPELRGVLSGLSRADSLGLNPHKGLFLPYGTGALLVRDGQRLRDTHAGTADYMPDHPEEFYDPSQYGPELSRPYRGLRVWLAVKLYGTARIRAALAEKRRLALQAAEAVERIPGLVMDVPPELSLFAFHVSWPGATREQENAATEELLARVTARQRVMLTGCKVRGRFLARVCVLSFRTREQDILNAVEDLEAETAALLSGRATAPVDGP